MGTDRTNIPMLMFPASFVPSDGQNLSQVTEGLYWSISYSPNGRLLQQSEFSSPVQPSWSQYPTSHTPDQAQISISRSDDKVWNILFSMTESYPLYDISGEVTGTSGTGNVFTIEWQGPLTDYSGSETNDYPDTDY